MKHNVEVRGHGHARHQGEPRQTFTDFHLQEEVNASCLLSTTTTCSSQLYTGGREQAATHTPLRTRSACKVDAHDRAHRLPSSNQLFVISARASEPSHQAASTSLSVSSCRSVAVGKARPMPLARDNSSFQIATHPYMERDPKRAVLGPCLHLQREPPQLDANDDNKAARETRLDGEAPPPLVISSPKRSRLAPCPHLESCS